ncbi:MAG: hypothetical protein IPI67_13820 [Myxococcales bacterium]|nr:hypothetical protein [Myxococcales bacterium]
MSNPIPFLAILLLSSGCSISMTTGPAAPSGPVVASLPPTAVYTTPAPAGAPAYQSPAQPASSPQTNPHQPAAATPSAPASRPSDPRMPPPAANPSDPRTPSPVARGPAPSGGLSRAPAAADRSRVSTAPTKKWKLRFKDTWVDKGKKQVEPTEAATPTRSAPGRREM